jgi:tetratricopeptide (TPR) repeat protein
MDKSGDAEKNLAKAIELNGEKFEYHHALARAHFEQKQFAKAVADLKTAEPLAKDDTTKYHLRSLRGMSYAALEKWPEAIDDLEAAARVKKTAGVVDRLAFAYYELRHYDKALPYIRDSLKLNPNNPGMQARLANALLSLAAETASDTQKDQSYKEALVASEKLREMEPNSADVHNLVGRSALGAGDFTKAEQAFRKVLALKSDHCWAAINLGKTYNAQQRWAEAESTLVDATHCDPRSAVAYSTLGFAQQKQKKLAEALAAYQKSYELKPDETVLAAINVCKENIGVAEHNKEMDEIEAKQKSAEEAEAARIAEEKRKAEEWEKRRKDD